MKLITSEFHIERIVVGQFGTNCYIVSCADRSAAIIDPGADETLILEHIRHSGLKAKYIFNTHGHYDHTGANHIKNHLSPKPVVGIHRDDESYLSDPALNLSEIFGIQFRSVSPDIFLSDGQKINLCRNLFFSIIHTPGHTPGSICLKLGNYLFSGDLLFSGGVGRTDLPGGNEELLMISLKKISHFDKNTVVLPGHGEETSIGKELETNPYFLQGI